MHGALALGCSLPARGPTAASCDRHGSAAPQVARVIRRRLLRAYAEVAACRVGAWPTPPAPETVALARELLRLRRTAPRWWVRVDPETRWRLARERPRWRPSADGC